MTPIIRIRLESQRLGQEIQYAYKMSTGLLDLITIEVEDWITVNKNAAEESWIAAPSGALLLALRGALRAIHDSSEDIKHAALLIENPMHSSVIDAMVFRPKGGTLYQEITRALNQHPVRVGYDTSAPSRDRDNAQYTWPKSEDRSTQPTEPFKEIERLKALVKELEAGMEEAYDARQVAQESLVEMQRRVSQINPPITENQRLIRMRNELDEVKSINKMLVDRLQPQPLAQPPQESVPEVETRFMDQAESILIKLWGDSVWKELPYEWRHECMQPLVIAQLIDRFDPMSDASYEWPAFLLARNTERLLNDWMIFAFRSWLSKQEQNSEFNRIGKRETGNTPSWTVYLGTSRATTTGTIKIKLADPSSLSLDDILKVFWDHPYVERPNELQEAVSQFFIEADVPWMQDDLIRKDLDILRKSIRNPGAHDGLKIVRDDYDQWVQLFIGSDNPSETATEAWWPAWIHAFSKTF